MPAASPLLVIDDDAERGASHLLVIDDDTELCELLAIRARASGYRVTTSPEIATTRRHIQRDDIDLILLDLDLAGHHGFDILDAVTTRAPHIPVIVLTASGTNDTEAEATRRGATAFITKPFHHRDLLEKVSTALHARPRHPPAP